MILVSVAFSKSGRQPAVFLALAVLTSGCSLWFDSEPEIETREIAFDVSPDLNEDYPLAFDLVFVGDPDLRSSIASMTSGEWFGQKPQLLRDFPSAMIIRSYEVVPGQQVVPIVLDDQEQEAIGAFLFADFRSDGPHRARLDLFESPLLVFGSRSLDVQDRS